MTHVARWSTCFALAVGLVLAPAQRARALAPQEQDYATYSASLDAAAEAESRGESIAAVEAYLAAYESLPPHDRVAELGGDVMRRVVDLLEAGPADLDDSEVLRQAVAAVENHLADAARLAPEHDTRVLADALARLQGRVDASEDLASAVQPETEPKEEVEPEVEPIPALHAAPPPSLDKGSLTPLASPAPRDRSRLWLGVTLAGASTTVLGVGAVGMSRLLHKQAQEEAEQNKANGFYSETDKKAAENADATSRAVLVAGCVAAAVGSAAFIAGLVKLRRNRRRARTSNQLVSFMGSGQGVAVVRF